MNIRTQNLKSMKNLMFLQVIKAKELMSRNKKGELLKKESSVSIRLKIMEDGKENRKKSF